MTGEEIVKTLRTRSRDGYYVLEHEAATLIESQSREIATLKTQLAYAEDSAAKGDLARQNAGGMEMEIAELKSQNAKLVKALEWRLVSELPKEEMRFVLTYSDGAIRTRTLLWNPRGFWEHPGPIGPKIGEHEQPTHWMELPNAPQESKALLAEIKPASS